MINTSFDVGYYDTRSADQANTMTSAELFIFDVKQLEVSATSNLVNDDAFETLEQTFERLSERWKEETINYSSLDDIAANASYKEIIRLGDRVVPLILRQMKASPDHWFSALSQITGVNPVKKTDAGKMRSMAAAWIKWGSEQGLL